MKRFIVFASLSILLFGQMDLPHRFALKTAIQDTTLYSGLKSNVIAEIKFQGDSLVWLGTGRGLALFDGQSMYAYNTEMGTLENGSETYGIPAGGISAISVQGDSLLAAIATDDGTIQMGGGLVFSTNSQDTNGVLWEYLSQPVDNPEDSLVPFGERLF